MVGTIARLVIGIALSATGAAAQDASRPGVLVELFTSQGCSSCPPADALLARLADRPDVVALALHVDYWDYLGWRDSHGSPRNTARQRAYAAAMNERMVYTPQIIVQGVAATVGSDEGRVLKLIAAAQPSPDVALTLRRDGAEVVAQAAPGPHTDVMVLAFFYDPPHAPTITRGENAGAELVYVNSVTDWRVLAQMLPGPAEWRITPPAGAAGLALVAQHGKTGPVLAATRMALD